MTQSTKSVWTARGGRVFQGPLDRDLQVDVAVIGGGITGLTAGVLLAQTGKSVVILEMLKIGSGESGQTTAHLTQVTDTRYCELISKYGEEGARIVADSSASAIDFIEKRIAESHSQCDFMRTAGYLYSDSKKDVEDLRREFEALKRVKIEARWQSALPFPFSSYQGIKCENQASFHPLAYLEILTEEFLSKGGCLFEETMVTDLELGEVIRLNTASGTVTAKELIVASHSPISERVVMHTKQAAYRTYAIAFETTNNAELVELFWDSQEPYHYLRGYRDPNGRPMVIVGGEDHKTGEEANTEECFQRLEEYGALYFSVSQVRHRWSGQILEPVDGLPFIGRTSGSNNCYVATGFSGNGLTFGTISGVLIADLILGNPNPWANLYDPTRIKPIAGAAKFVSENLDVTWQYLKGWLAPADLPSLLSVLPGEGKVVRIGTQKMAVYRDVQGRWTALSAVCPHLGGHVSFNTTEKSWDCPCHGSRFDLTGKVLNGPAISPLARVELGAARDSAGYQPAQPESVRGEFA